jgi:hypothetical protein
MFMRRLNLQKAFVEVTYRMCDYYLDGLGGIVVSGRRAREVLRGAEWIAALVSYASGHWESCVAGGRNGISFGLEETRRIIL